MTRDELILASCIMKAGAEGRTVHYKPRRGGDWVQTDPLTTKWNWGINEYKAQGVEMRTVPGLSALANPTPVAQTQSIQFHNPHNLNSDQIGVVDGWRLLTEDEYLRGERNRRGDVEYFYDPTIHITRRHGWHRLEAGYQEWGTETIRTRLPLPPSVGQPTLNWQNPAGLTQEQLGEGWRFCLVSEMDRLPRDGEYWDRHMSPPRWMASAHRGVDVAPSNRAADSYRTRTPLPYNLRSEPITMQDLYHDDAALIAELNSPIGGMLTMHPPITIPQGLGDPFPPIGGLHTWEDFANQIRDPEEDHDVEDIPMQPL